MKVVNTKQREKKKKRGEEKNKQFFCNDKLGTRIQRNMRMHILYLVVLKS